MEPPKRGEPWLVAAWDFECLYWRRVWTLFKQQKGGALWLAAIPVGPLITVALRNIFERKVPLEWTLPHDYWIEVATAAAFAIGVFFKAILQAAPMIIREQRERADLWETRSEALKQELESRNIVLTVQGAIRSDVDGDAVIFDVYISNETPLPVAISVELRNLQRKYIPFNTSKRTGKIETIFKAVRLSPGEAESFEFRFLRSYGPFLRADGKRVRLRLRNILSTKPPVKRAVSDRPICFR